MGTTHTTRGDCCQKPFGHVSACCVYQLWQLDSQYYVQPLSPTVSSGNDLYNTNSPSASMVTVFRNHLDTCAHAVFTTCGNYSRAVFISTKSFGLCGHYLRAATIRRWHLFEKIWTTSHYKGHLAIVQYNTNFATVYS